MNNYEHEKHMDLMEEMVGHTLENGFIVRTRGYKVLTEKEDKNIITRLATVASVELAGKKELEELQARFPNKKFDFQKGDSRLEDESMMFWWIISEKI